MESRVWRLAVMAQVCLYAGLVVAVLVKPAGLAANDGISYYGIYARTVVPYEFGLLGAAFFCWLAAKGLHAAELRLLKAGLSAFALLTSIIAVTPYSVGSVLGWLHTAAGSALFSLQLLLSFWLVARLHYRLWVSLLALIELAAGIASAIYLEPAHGLLIQSQVIFQFAFGTLLVLALRPAKQA